MAEGTRVDLSGLSITTALPREELYGLTTQIRRSWSSIPANLAEGCGRNGRCRTRAFLLDRDGIGERTQVSRLVARDLRLINLEDYEDLTQRTVEVKRMLAALIKKLKAER